MGAGGVGLPLVNTAECSDCHRASVNSRSQAALSHSDTHTCTQIRHMHGWPSVPKYRLWRMRERREACARKHAHHFAAVVSRRRGCVGSHLCTQLHFLRAATDPLTLWRTIWTAGGGNGLRSGFMCFHVKASCRINQKVEERWFRGNARLFLQPLLF